MYVPPRLSSAAYQVEKTPWGAEETPSRTYPAQETETGSRFLLNPRLPP
jgi:hypothetical protein